MCPCFAVSNETSQCFHTKLPRDIRHHSKTAKGITRYRHSKCPSPCGKTTLFTSCPKHCMLPQTTTRSKGIRTTRHQKHTCRPCMPQQNSIKAANTNRCPCCQDTARHHCHKTHMLPRHTRFHSPYKTTLQHQGIPHEPVLMLPRHCSINTSASRHATTQLPRHCIRHVCADANT
jgi:hypothetical protein